MVTLPPVLTWDHLAAHRPAFPGPVVVAGASSSARTLAVARLAAEQARSGAKILWIGARHVVRPLAWMPLTEQRLDARPLRPAFGGSPWPRVNPFSLEPGPLVEWLAYASGELYPEGRRQIAAALSDVIAKWSVGRVPWVAPTFEQGMAMLESRLPGIAQRLSAHGVVRSVMSDECVSLDFNAAQLTVISGHPDDLVRRENEALLILLAFVSRALSRPSERHLMVVEDWIDRLTYGAREAAVTALLDACRIAHAEVIVASEAPGRWGDNGGALAFLDGALPIVIEPDVELPAYWATPTFPGKGNPPAKVPSAFVLTRTREGPTWKEFLLPSPAIEMA